MLYLHTHGHPVLHGAACPLRKKDLALLVYLRTERDRAHPRSRLAGLLWGAHPECRARHSLTQALGRVQKAVGGAALALEQDCVRWTGALECDLDALHAPGGALTHCDGPTVEVGHFLEGFDAGPGAAEFHDWADRRRAELRNAALRLLERCGEAAEAAGEWERALRLGERAVEVDPLWERGHRRVIRALAARGERNRAIRYYEEFERWLRDEVGGPPDPETRTLAMGLCRDEAPAAPRPPAAPPAPLPRFAAPPPPPRPALPPPLLAPAPPLPARPHASSSLAATLLFLALALVLGGAAVEESPDPGQGESVQLRSGGPVYLAANETLYAYPDSATLLRCLGGRPGPVRKVRSLPDWPRERLPSVRLRPWQGDTLLVAPTETGHHPHPLVAVGCVLAPVWAEHRLDSIYGSERRREHQEHEWILHWAPHTQAAGPFPVRPAGTLIQGPGDTLRWVLFHGGSLGVPDARALAAHCRSPGEAVRVSREEFVYYRPSADLPPATGPCRREPPQSLAHGP